MALAVIPTRPFRGVHLYIKVHETMQRSDKLSEASKY